MRLLLLLDDGSKKCIYITIIYTHAPSAAGARLDFLHRAISPRRRWRTMVIIGAIAPGRFAEIYIACARLSLLPFFRLSLSFAREKERERERLVCRTAALILLSTMREPCSLKPLLSGLFPLSAYSRPYTRHFFFFLSLNDL